ncbi:MAG: beta-ketoacyl-ACP synthase, partial [Sneathiella sp.]
KMDRFIAFALVAAQEALQQAGWHPSTAEEQMRTATIIASGIGGFPALKQAVETVASRGVSRLSPFTVPAFLANLAAGWVSIQNGLKGPISTPVTACAAGVQAIGDAMRLIQNEEADIAVCGGTEACIDRVSLGSFAAARALSTNFNDMPKHASRPFDCDRDGFVMGEGSGMLVIESEDHAHQRGATILCELAGYGTSADAYHLTAGPENGEGAARAMQAALKQAHLAPYAIDHINAHSTSTPVGDRSEIAAIRSVFGDKPGPGISATKSATGHLLGAAGGLEAVFAIKALMNDVMPPTLNLSVPDPAAAGLRIVGPAAERRTISTVLSNGFGFGGVNASVIFKERS